MKLWSSVVVVIALSGTSAMSTACAGPRAISAPAAAHSSDSSTRAAGLEEKEAWAQMARDLNDKATRTSRACDTAVTAAYDIGSFSGVDLKRRPVQTYAQWGVEAVGNVCASEIGKQTVREKVKHIVVRRSTTGTRVSVVGGVLTVHIDPERTGIIGNKPGSYTFTSAVREAL